MTDVITLDALGFVDWVASQAALPGRWISPVSGGMDWGSTLPDVWEPERPAIIGDAGPLASRIWQDKNFGGAMTFYNPRTGLREPIVWLPDPVNAGGWGGAQPGTDRIGWLSKNPNYWAHGASLVTWGKPQSEGGLWGALDSVMGWVGDTFFTSPLSLLMIPVGSIVGAAWATDAAIAAGDTALWGAGGAVDIAFAPIEIISPSFTLPDLSQIPMPNLVSEAPIMPPEFHYVIEPIQPIETFFEIEPELTPRIPDVIEDRYPVERNIQIAPDWSRVYKPIGQRILHDLLIPPPAALPRRTWLDPQLRAPAPVALAGEPAETSRLALYALGALVVLKALT